MKYFVEKKNCLMNHKQYEAKLNRLSPIRWLLNKFKYDSNMRYTESKIWRALKRGQSVCCLEYSNATEGEIKDIIARLEYMGYDIDFYYLGTHIDSEIRVRLSDN